jgi:hypothetical protein
LPFTAALAQVVLKSWDQGVDLGLGAEAGVESIHGVLSGVADDGALVGQGIQDDVQKSLILEKENSFTERELAGEALKEGTDDQHGTLALGAVLLIGSGLAGLSDDIVVEETGSADTLNEEVGDGICAIEGDLGRLGCEDCVQERRNLFVGGGNPGGGLGDNGRHGGGLRRRDSVWHGLL